MRVSKTFSKDFFNDKDIYGCVTYDQGKGYLPMLPVSCVMHDGKCFVCEEKLMLDDITIEGVRLRKRDKEVLTLCFACIGDLQLQLPVKLNNIPIADIKEEFDRLGVPYTEESMARLELKLADVESGKISFSEILNKR